MQHEERLNPRQKGKQDVPGRGVNRAFAECVGDCSVCQYAIPRTIKGTAGGKRFACIAGRMNLWTDRAHDLFGVRQADALGDAAGSTQVKGAEGLAQ